MLSTSAHTVLVHKSWCFVICTKSSILHPFSSRGMSEILPQSQPSWWVYLGKRRKHRKPTPSHHGTYQIPSSPSPRQRLAGIPTEGNRPPKQNMHYPNKSDPFPELQTVAAAATNRTQSRKYNRNKASIAESLQAQLHRGTIFGS